MRLEHERWGDDEIPVVHTAVKIIIMNPHNLGVILSDANDLEAARSPFI